MVDARLDIVRRKMERLEQSPKIIIRCASIPEVFNIASSGNIQACEVLDYDEDFKKLIKWHSFDSWDRIAKDITDWDHLLGGLETEEHLIFLIKSLHAKKLGKKKLYAQIQEQMRKILEEFSYYIGTLLFRPMQLLDSMNVGQRKDYFVLMLEGKKEECLERLPGILLKGAREKYSEYQEGYEKDIEQGVKDLMIIRSLLSPEEINLFTNLLFDLAYLKKNPKMLRALIQLVVKLKNLDGGEGLMRTGFGETGGSVDVTSGYAVILVFDPDIPKEEHFLGQGWSKVLQCNNADQYLLGVLVMLKDRKTTQQIAEKLTANDSNINVPIFDTNGNLFWPKIAV